MARPSAEELAAVVAREGSNRKAAAVFSVNESTVRRWRKADGNPSAPPTGGEPAKTTIKGDEAVIVTTPSEKEPKLGELGDLIRSHGLDPDEWEVVVSGLNKWQMLAYGGGPDGEPRLVWLKQLKVTLKRRATVELVSPATHVPELVKPAKRTVAKAGAPRLVVVEGDHQAPYYDEQLDAAATQMIADLQPDGWVALGDGMDLPRISRHKDHPAANATVQECINSYYGILRRRREAAPNAWAKKLAGNHDFRLEDELLTRAERMFGVHPAGEVDPALSMRRLLHLDTLGIELVEDERGWQHAEVELAPGRGGLVVRHGFVTGHNTAGRTLDKLGRSVIVGHDHSKASVYKLVYPDRQLLQAHVVGGMFRNDSTWPHFAVEPNWHPGMVTATIWPNGRYQVDHATWQDGRLYWRDRSW